MTSIKVSREAAQSSVHIKGVSFLSRVMRGLAMATKFRIKGCWYPKTPNIL